MIKVSSKFPKTDTQIRRFRRLWNAHTRLIDVARATGLPVKTCKNLRYNLAKRLGLKFKPHRRGRYNGAEKSRLFGKTARRNASAKKIIATIARHLEKLLEVVGAS